MRQREAASYDLAGGQQRLITWLNRWVDLQASDPDNPLKEKTLADYRFKLDYVVDLLGQMILADIKPDHCDDAIRRIRKKLARTTADQIRNLFYRAMHEAARRDYILRNPVDRPQRRPRKRHDDKGHVIFRLDAQQAIVLLGAAAARPEALAWWLLLLLGLREGEVLGLRRSDVDLANATITIAQQYTQLGSRAHLSTTKTPYSDRVLPFPRALVPVFEALLTALNRRAEKAMRRGTWQEHGLLFPGKSGRPMNPTSLYHILKRLLVAAELPAHVNVHHLRHTAAAFYVSLQAPDNVRAAIAGHSPKTITDYYGKPPIETLRPWVERVYTLLGGEAGLLERTA